MSEVRKYVSMILAVSDLAELDVAKTIVSCMTVAVDGDGERGAGAECRFNRCYRLLHASHKGIAKLTEKSERCFRADGVLWLSKDVVYNRKNLVDYFARLVKFHDDKSPKQPEERNYTESLFRSYIRGNGDHRISFDHARAHSLSNVASPYRRSPSLRCSSSGTLVDAGDDIYDSIVREERDYVSERDAQVAKWTFCFELVVLQICLSCVGMDTMRRIAQHDADMFDEFGKRKDILAFVCLSVAKLPAARIMDRCVNHRKHLYDCENVLRAADSSTAAMASRHAFTTQVAMFVHYWTMVPTGALEDYTAACSRLYKTANREFLGVDQPYTAERRAEVESHVEGTVRSKLSATLLAAAASASATAESCGCEMCGHLDEFLTRRGKQGGFSLAGMQLSDRNLFSLFDFGDGDGVTPPAEKELVSIHAQWAAHALRTLCQIYKFGSFDFLRGVFAEHAEDSASLVAECSNFRFANVYCSRAQHRRNGSEGEIMQRVLVLPVGVSRSIENRVKERLILERLIEDRRAVDVYYCEALCAGSDTLRNYAAVDRLMHFYEHPMGDVWFNAKCLKLNALSNPERLEEIAQTVVGRLDTALFSIRLGTEDFGYALMFTSDESFRNLFEVFPATMLTAPTSVKTRFDARPSRPDGARGPQRCYAKSIYEAGRMFARCICDTDQKDPAARMMAMSALNRLVSRGSALQARSGEFERAFILRVILYRLVRSERESSARSAELVVWHYLTQPFLTSFASRNGTRGSRRSDFCSFDPRQSAPNMYVALKTYLGARDAEKVRIHVRSLVMLSERVLNKRHYNSDSCAQRSVASMVPAVAECVKYGLEYAHRNPSEVYIPLCSGGGDSNGHAKAADYCMALYVLCASERFVTDVQAKQIFFDLRSMRKHSLPQFSDSFRLSFTAVRKAPTEMPPLGGDAMDLRIFTMLFSSLIYLNQFSVTTYNRDAVDAVNKCDERIFFAQSFDTVASAPGGQREQFKRQYRGSVAMGQMIAHSSFYNMSPSHSSPLGDTAGGSELVATNLYMPLPLVRAPSRRAEAFHVGDKLSRLLAQLLLAQGKSKN